MTFRIGQKVVRVGSRKIGCGLVSGKDYSAPDLGEVCTISAIREWPSPCVTIVTFVEHNNSHLIGHNGWPFEPGFDARCFRPIVERKTDITVFHEILRKVSRKDRVWA